MLGDQLRDGLAPCVTVADPPTDGILAALKDFKIEFLVSLYGHRIPASLLGGIVKLAVFSIQMAKRKIIIQADVMVFPADASYTVLNDINIIRQAHDAAPVEHWVIHEVIAVVGNVDKLILLVFLKGVQIGAHTAGAGNTGNGTHLVVIHIERVVSLGGQEVLAHCRNLCRSKPCPSQSGIQL